MTVSSFMRSCALLILLVSFGACRKAQDGVSTLNKGCQTDEQCGSGRSCRDGECIAPCQANEDCAAGQACAMGVCQTVTAQCQQDSDCPSGRKCSGNVCIARFVLCNTSDECASGELCIRGMCQPPPAPRVCPTCAPTSTDSDGDCLSNTLENVSRGPSGINGVTGTYSNPNDPDSDDDGIGDGCEDATQNGLVDAFEGDPRLADTDGDGLADAIEDRNKNGVRDEGETFAYKADSDGDNLTDGLEDSGGCFNSSTQTSCSGQPSGCNCAQWHDGVRQANETDPLKDDTDGDGLRDRIEDQNGDGVCQKAVEHRLPRASDETCGYLADTDGDVMTDGFEDKNLNGKLDFGETNPRFRDFDSDCLDDGLELLVGTDPFLADTDRDGILDGVETGIAVFRSDGTCQPIDCSGAGEVAYRAATCSDPLLADTDGDGAVDGVETINGYAIGEDVNGDGCSTPGESDPCHADRPTPPAVDGPGVCTYCGVSGCTGNFSTDASKCAGQDFSTCTCPMSGCDPNEPCVRARATATSLLCAEGNLRPLSIIRSEAHDYALALVATKGASGVIVPFYDANELQVSGAAVGHVFQSNAVAAAPTGIDPIAGVFGAIVRIVPRDDATYTAPTGAVTPDYMADRTADRLNSLIGPSGGVYAFVRTAGGTTLSHDDETVTGNPNATVSQQAIDRYLIRRVDAGMVDPVAIKQQVIAALLAGASYTGDLVPPAGYPVGPVVELRIEHFRRVVQKRVFNNDGSSTLVDALEYGALFALGALSQDCTGTQGQARTDCKLAVEPTVIPIDDITNGSALARYQAQTGRACDSFDPTPAKADFLMVIDDSSSMQPFILAIQRATRDVAFKLQANANNLDWRIAMTGSTFGGQPLSNLQEGAGQPAPNDQLALPEAFMPGTDSAGSDQGYPVLNVTDPVTPPTSPTIFFGYQHSAYGPSGDPVRCVYGPQFVPGQPEISPFCCNDPGGTLTDEQFLLACCSLPNGTSIPASFTGKLTIPASNTATIDPTNPTGNDTLRCFDFPRFPFIDTGGDNPIGYYGTSSVSYTADLSSLTSVVAATGGVQALHLQDYACGDWRLTRATTSDDFSLTLNSPPRLWGTRGHLFPPGFQGSQGTAGNPRLDGANLLIRNADILMMQMNRFCYRHQGTPRVASADTDTPRVMHGSGLEMVLQAAKRAIERSTEGGRTGATGPADPFRLRADAPVITLILSDEEDYSLKFYDNSPPPPVRPSFTRYRDRNQLPAPLCLGNGDRGCTTDYCESCYAANVDAGNSAQVIPGAREIMAGALVPTGSGAYCVSPGGALATQSSVQLSCSNAADFCSAGTTSDVRYNGFHTVNATVNENSDGSVASMTAEANSVSRDVLNPVAATGSAVATCGSDRLACTRFLRDKQYIDFFSGRCSPPDGSTPADADPRRYPLPKIDFPTGALLMKTGPVYAITRGRGESGLGKYKCNARGNFNLGDGSAFREVALGTGGRVTDICLGEQPGGFSEFLEQIIVEAQGFGSPYRLSGVPISSTVRVGVLAKDGTLRILRRSSESGFEYNAVTRTVAFFSKGAGDEANLVTKAKDAKVIVSYRVWTHPCGGDCAVGDACSICTCDVIHPECCTPLPSYACVSPQCPTCGNCQACDAATTTCRSASNCDGSCTQACRQDATGKYICQDCAPGTVPVVVPCVGEGACPAVPTTVCASQGGVPNNGSTCVVTNTPEDCCGAEKSCAGLGSNYICVYQGCSGESCLGTATCQQVTSQQPGDWCGQCPLGTVCAPVPCGGESCQPEFHCVAENLGGSASCQEGAQCGCTCGVCADCPAGSFCDANNTCKPLCDLGVSKDACCTDPANRNTIAGCGMVTALACCPPDQRYNATTEQCEQVPVDCNCPPGYYCDPVTGICNPRGG